MASSTPREIPTIVLSNENMKPGTGTWIQACKEIRRAFEDCGCFVGVYDKFPSELHNEIYAVADELFSLPKDTKMQKISDKPYHDYFGNYPDFPLYESIPVENPTLGGAQNVTVLMWPAGNDRFSKSVHSFGKLLVELEQLVRRLILESYGIEKYYDSQIESSEYMLRFFKYRIPEIDETNAGIPPHTDKNMVSILHQNHVNGLQVKNKDGNWVDLELSPSSFVFLAAEALVAWSNGRIRSCEHQVIMKAMETRYSLGLFSFNKGNIVVPEELVDDLHPLQYKPFDVYEYLWFSKSEEGMKVNGSIKAFCGVEDPQLMTENTTADLQ